MRKKSLTLMRKCTLHFLIFFACLPLLSAQKYQSLLWEISGNGLKKPSYLYGTIHIQDSRVFQFTPEMLKAFKKSKVYAMELIPDATAPLLLLSKMKLESGKLRDLYTPEQWTVIEAWFAEKKIPLALIEDFKPFVAYSMTATDQFNSDMELALDLHLLKMAKSQKKETKGLETVEEQIAAINIVSEKDQAKMLYDAVTDTSSEGTDMNKMLDLYLKQDLDSLMTFSDEFDYGADFDSVMVTVRNQRMADRMVPLMQLKPVFTAVGALHLPGEEGIISILRKKGYTVKPVVSL